MRTPLMSHVKKAYKNGLLRHATSRDRLAIGININYILRFEDNEGFYTLGFNTLHSVLLYLVNKSGFNSLSDRLKFTFLRIQSGLEYDFLAFVLGVPEVSLKRYESGLDKMEEGLIDYFINYLYVNNIHPCGVK